MKNAGRTRKSRRKARRREYRNANRRLSQSHGDHWVSTTAKQERSDAALVKMALRWNTDFDGSDENRLADHPEELKKASAKDIALMVTRRNLASDNPKVANDAAKILVAMEAQNQKDDHVDKRAELSEQNSSSLSIIQNNVFMDASPEDLIKLKLAMEQVQRGDAIEEPTG
jgi:hypothetical protein